MLIVAWTAGFIATLGLASCSNVSTRPASSGEAAYTAAIEDWRERRDAGLRSPDGWLTLVGLDWLQPGANTIGSGSDNRIRLPGGPQAWGSVVLDGDSLRFEPAPGVPLTIDGEPLEVMLAKAVGGSVPLVADNAGDPTVVASGTLSFHVIFRESYALRVQDSEAETRTGFRGVPTYPIAPDWRIDARFEPAPSGTTIDIGDVLGHVTANPVFGTIEFEREGRVHHLVGVGEADSDSLWFIFADRTSGHETYGAGRFVYSDGMPREGHLVVDFNKAYNPPCVFTEYSTCPLPPQANRLDLAVRAGEKDYHP
ncbi:DUF1684 domain-containing protein [Elongatibacter sediminis]|uniref:DUF1684 domain-containing protein n=1 Tax=Elongatibacter sediminis TaxID=3119006 RepID=A0AAW9R852_9GAMM